MGHDLVASFLTMDTVNAKSFFDYEMTTKFSNVSMFSMSSFHRKRMKKKTMTMFSRLRFYSFGTPPFSQR